MVIASYNGHGGTKSGTSSMQKLVILELEGDFHETGFRATLAIREEVVRTSLKVRGFLPPAPDMVELLHYHWHDAYRSLGLAQRIKSQKIIHKGSLNQRIVTCRESATHLRDRFQTWLNSESFQPIDRRLREELNRMDMIRFLLRTDDVNLQRLPWNEWDFFSRYFKAELAFSPPEYEAHPPQQILQHAQSSSVRILAILGHRQGINLESDRELLEQLPHADVEFLVEPNRQQVSDRLWEQPWDILFFAGHSETQGETGRIYINPVDSFSLSELKYSLQKAIHHGLQLAIFNSCDGLGLARELQSLSLAQMILMREPVTDQVAQTFLRYFLNGFSSGEPLYLATRHARERLQGLEDCYPCASWLPVLYQNPLADPPDWYSLWGNANEKALTNEDHPEVTSGGVPVATRSAPKPGSAPKPRREAIAHSSTLRLSRSDQGDVTPALPTAEIPQLPLKKSLTASSPQPSKKKSFTFLRRWLPPAFVAWISLTVTLIVMVVRFSGILQGFELAAYDQLMRLRPTETIDNRILVVEVTQNDVDAQGGFPLDDQTLTETVQALQALQPQAIGLDMHRYRPRGEGRSELMNLFQQDSNLFLVCAFNNPNQARLSQDYAPPPEFSETQRIEQVGFSNFPIDQQHQPNALGPNTTAIGTVRNEVGSTVRRQLLTYQPDLAANPSSCLTPYSFSFQLAYRYLFEDGLTPLDVNKDGHWQFGDVAFRPLPRRFGGYQALDSTSDQIMVNYRSVSSGQRVSLGDVLHGQIDPSIVRNRVVLVGYTAPIARDTIQTPYGTMYGVWVHAHMTSQLLCAVRDDRPLIWALPQWRNIQWGDSLWILVWSLISGIIAYGWRSRPWRLGVGFVLLIVSIHQFALLFLMQGGWVPLVPTLISGIVVGVMVAGNCTLKSTTSSPNLLN